MATIEGFAEEVLESESDIASNTSESSRDESSDNESQHEHNDDLASTRDKLADWFLGLNDEQINLRKNCVKIHVLAPFLLGIIPPQYEKKFISWSYQCGLLPSNEVKQDFDPTNEAFENIQIVENGFEVLSQIMNKKQIIIQMLELKNQLVNCTSYKSAFKCAKKKDWFLCERDVCLPKDATVERAIMALLLTAYQFAVHIQLSYVKKTDVLKISSSSKDCKEVEEKTLKLKENGNEEFRSKNYEGAITFYSKAIHESPFNHIVYGNRAQSYKNLGEYRKALMDAKRTIILKPDWDKGLYRFKEAAAALQDGEGGKASFLSFCVDKHIIDDETKQSRARDVKKQNSVTTNDENYESDDTIPPLVSADEDDTSSCSSSDNMMIYKDDMPDLLEDYNTDSKESDVDQNVDYNFHTVQMREKSSSREKKRPKMSKVNLGILRQQKELKENSEKIEQTRSAEKKSLKVDKYMKPKGVYRSGKLVKKEQVSLPETKTQIEGILREGSKALLNSSFTEACKSYKKALDMIDAGPRKSLDYDDMKYAVVLYAYGTALAGTDLHMNIETASSIFQNIITSLKTINFPLAHYGLSRSLIRQNRFHEAIQILNGGLNLMNQLTCEINWPGTDIVIDETQTGKLESSLNNALTACKYPPKADAICRYEKCLGMKKSIYISDLDYNGYVGIVCTEACLVEYHIQCWKKFKSSFIDFSSDKDFLGTKCITSNCNGEIKVIKIYDSEGLKTELLSDKLKLKKDKVQVTVNSKKKKRSKKKGKHVAYEDSMKERVSEVLDEKPCSLPSDEMQSLDIPLKDEKDPSKEKIHLTEKDHEELSMVPESGMFILKKDYDQTENLGTKPLKGKHRKKKTKNVQSLDEFLGPDNENLRLRPYQHDEENYDEIPSESFTRRPPEGWNRNLFSIPAHLKHEAQEIENSLSLNNHDSIREYVRSAFNNLLKVQGPLHIESDQMERLFNIMPEEVHSIVRNEGGLRKFLKNLNFIIEEDIIQSYEDKLITDRKMSLTKPHEENTKNATEGDIFTAKIVHLSNATGKEYLRNNTDELSLTGTYFENGVNFDSWVRAKDFMPSQKSLPTSNDAVGFHDIHVLDDHIDRANNLNLLETSVNCMDEKTNDALSTANSAKAFYSKREEIATVYPETYNSLNSLPADHGENIYKISSVDHSDDVKQVFMREKEISIAGDSDTSSSITVKMSNQSISTEKYSNFLYNVRTTVATQTTASTLSKEYTEDIMKESKNETIVDNDSTTKLAVNKTHQQVERKSTKEKGILCKPNTKTKITMTDPTSELTKVEVDKLLRSAKTWENKYLDEQVKNTRMEKSHKTEIGNLQKRLDECRQNLQVLAEEHEEYKAFHSREIQDFTTEKRERDERIQQLEEKVILTVVGEERRREELQVELTALRKEKEQWKLDEGKLRKLLELQAKRACDAEMNFLELQRHVNVGAFTRALQESELTLHHINQILSANFTPQLQDYKVQWQRYIVDCKFKFDRNKSMFDSSITKLKEGIPLSSLTSLRIVRPSPYPAPPILQLPPGISVPPGNKAFPKHVNKSNQATVSTHGSFAFPGGASTSMGFRSLGPERFPVNPTSSTNHKESETDTKPANNYEKIILRLSTQFPCYTRNEIIFFIKKLRASKSGSLTGLSFDDVVDCVAKLIKEREQQMSNAIASAAAGPSNSIATRAQTSASRTSSLPLTRPQSTLPQKPSTTASKLAPTAIKPVIQASKSLTTSALTTTKPVSSASLLCYEDPCVICHDEMSDATKNVSLDCGHKFHHDCIKKWLTGEQSTCPTCRVHALLPDEFPQLK